MGMGIAMYVSAMFFATWLSPKAKRRIVGQGLATDIAVHLVLQSVFGHDAAGRVGMLLAGLMVNVTMHGYRKVYGYEKFVLTGPDKGWQRYAGTRTEPEVTVRIVS